MYSLLRVSLYMFRATKKYRSKLTQSQNVDFAYNVYWQCIALQITFQEKKSIEKENYLPFKMTGKKIFSTEYIIQLIKNKKIFY